MRQQIIAKKNALKLILSFIPVIIMFFSYCDDSNGNNSFSFGSKNQENKRVETNSVKPFNSFKSDSLTKDFITDPNWGFKVYVPSGWKYKKGNNNIIFGHNTIAGAIFVFSHMSINIDQVRNDLISGISENTLRLRLSGNIINISSNILSCEYNGVMNGEQVKAKGYGTLSPFGGGAYIIAITTPEKFSQELIRPANSLARGIEYKKKDRSLMSHFVGTWKTYTKYSESTTVLYANGRFVMRKTSSYGGNQGEWGMASDQDNSGKWNIQGNKSQGTLILIFKNGNQETFNYRVHIKGSTTYWSEYYFEGVLYSKQ